MGSPKSITVYPYNGGKLLASLPGEAIGLANYRVKRDFRRNHVATETRSEGYTWFRPDAEHAQGTQALPAGLTLSEPLTLLVKATRADGRWMLVAGTKTTLWAYWTPENGGMFQLGLEVFAAGEDYFSEETSGWTKIGGGFSPNGKRWQWQRVSNWLVLNNGVDLPVTYVAGDLQVEPIWELRDNLIASIGVIGTYKDMLVGADIRELREDQVADYMGPISSGTTKVWQEGAKYSGLVTAKGTGSLLETSTGYFKPADVGKKLLFANGQERTLVAVTGTRRAVIAPDLTTDDWYPFWVMGNDGSEFIVKSERSFFTPSMVGMNVVWEDGDVRVIEEVINTTTVRVNSFIGTIESPVWVSNPKAYQAVEDNLAVDRFKDRVLNSDVEGPRRFNVAVNGTTAAGSRIVYLERPVKSFTDGQRVTVNGAGLSGGNLSAKIDYISSDGRLVLLDTPAETTLTGTSFYASDSIGSAVGYDTLADDDSYGPILGFGSIRTMFYVFKEGAVYAGYYRPETAAALNYQRVYAGPNGVHYPHTIIPWGANYLLYAGKKSFCIFDANALAPAVFEPLEVCKDIFYAAVDGGDREAAFSCYNELTNEIFISFPGSGVDKMLRIDCASQTVSTSSMDITCGCVIPRPLVGAAQQRTEDWLVMGTRQGEVLRYGLTNAKEIEGNGIWQGTEMVAQLPVFTSEHIGRTLLMWTGAGWVGSEILELVSPMRIKVSTKCARASGTFKVLPGLWSRNGKPYESILESGLEAMGAPMDSKYVHLLQLCASQRTVSGEITVELLRTDNAGKEPEVMLRKSLPSIQAENLWRTYFLGLYFGTRMAVNGINNPVTLSSRSLKYTVRRYSGYGSPL